MDPITIRWSVCSRENFGSSGGTRSKGFEISSTPPNWRGVTADEILVRPINGHGKVSRSIEMVFPKSAIPELIAALTMIGLMDG